MRTSIMLLATATLFGWAVPAHASGLKPDAVRFKGRHLVAFNVGAITDVVSSASVDAGDGVTVEAEGSGGLAAIRYAYWFQEHMALDVSVGVADADAAVSVHGTETTTQGATVTRVLVGVRFQPQEIAMGRNIRPYVVGQIGPYAGQAGSVRTGIALVEIGAHSDTAMGMRLGVGLDLLVWSHLALGVEAGYGLVGDFDRPIGRESNYSSPDFLISAGVSFGGGR
jgi:hypothetical protein